MRRLPIVLLLLVLAVGSGACSTAQPAWTFAQPTPTAAPSIAAPSATASGGGAGVAPVDAVAALAQAQADHPDQAVTLAPVFHIDPLDLPPSAVNAVLASASVRAGTAAATDAATYSIDHLEAAYEKQFCQLNADHGVTLQSAQCQADIAWIKGQAGTGGFDLAAQPILNNPAGVTGITFEVVHYSTKVALPGGERTFGVSGGLILPQGIGADGIKGVVTYFHGTTFDKSVVGSNYDGNPETRLMAEVFASQGYIVVIPDYVGQGPDDWADVHPYVLYPKVSAKTAADMLAAVAPTIRDTYGLDAATTLKLFSAGYSEGGAYSLWFASYLHEHPDALDALYRLTHSVGMEGAYSTSNVTKGFLFDDVEQGGSNPYSIHTQAVTNIVKPLLSADAFLSYATYQLGGDMASVFNPDFYAMKCVSLSLLPKALQAACNVGGKNLDMAGAFAQPSTNVAASVLASAIRKSANGATYPANLVLSWKNSVNSLVSPTLLADAGQAQLDAALKAADVDLSGLPDKAVTIISLDLDSVVTPTNYAALLAAYPTKIRDAYTIPSHSLQVVSPFSYYVQSTPMYVDVDHIQALAYEFLFALNTFNQF